MDAGNDSFVDWRFFPTMSGAPSFLSYALPLLAAVILAISRSKGSHQSAINPKDMFEFSNIPRLRRFMEHSIEILTTGAAQFLSKPYKLFCEWGELTVLPPETIDAIKSDKRFDFSVAASDVCHLP